jgi:hypothetical protein
VPVVRSTVGPFKPVERPSLGPEEMEIARPSFVTVQTEVRNWDGTPVADDPTWPVLLIGNSYTRIFREQLIRELNMPIRSRIADAMTTEAFGDFLREPDLLAGVKVVAWVTTEQHFAHFKPLPPAVAEAGR